MNSFRVWIDKHSNVLFLSLVFFLCFGILTISGNLFAGPRLVDDNQIFRLQKSLDEYGFMSVAIKEIRGRVVNLGRFVPFFLIVKVAKAKILGSSLFAWSVYTGLLVVFTAFFLFRFAKIVGFSTLESCFFSLLTVVGEQSAVWWKLIQGEGLGMLCLSISLMCMGLSVVSENRRRLASFLYVLFAVLASLSKESFILMLPALAFWPIWLTAEKHDMSLLKAVRRNVLTIAAISFVFIQELTYMIYIMPRSIEGMGYAGWEGFDFRNFVIAFGQFSKLSGSWILLTLILFLLLSTLHKARKHGNQKVILDQCSGSLLMFFLLLLIVLPQILLYSKSGFVAEGNENLVEEVLFSRYLLPGIIGFAYAIAFLIRQMREEYEITGTAPGASVSRVIMILSVVVVLVGLGGKLKSTYDNAFSYAKRSESIERWLNSIVSNTKESDRIWVIYNAERPGDMRRLERILSEMLNRRNVVYHPVFPIQDSPQTFDMLVEKEHSRNNVRTQTESAAQIDAIIILGKELEECFLNDSKAWFNPAEFRGYVLVGWQEEAELSKKWNRKK